MKLSEAIRLNGIVMPQGYGVASFWSDEAPCALGGARISAGLVRPDHDDNRDSYDFLRDAFPILNKILPHVCAADESCWVISSDGDGLTTVLRMVYHLNDCHRWSRERIAEWVADIEPAEISQAVPPIYAEYIAGQYAASERGLPPGIANAMAEQWSNL